MRGLKTQPPDRIGGTLPGNGHRPGVIQHHHAVLRLGRAQPHIPMQSMGTRLTYELAPTLRVVAEEDGTSR